MVHLFIDFCFGGGGARVSVLGGLLLVSSATVSSCGKGTTALASLANSCERCTSLGLVRILATACISSLRGFLAFLLSWSFLPTTPFLLLSGIGIVVDLHWCKPGVPEIWQREFLLLLMYYPLGVASSICLSVLPSWLMGKVPGHH